MKVEKIDHIAIRVKDLEKASKFFSDLLGIEFSGPNENKGADIRSVASPVGIALTEPLSPDGPSARALERRGEGLAMLSLQVKNFEQAAAEMKSHGIRQVVEFGTKTALFHPQDLHGVMIELLER